MFNVTETQVSPPQNANIYEAPNSTSSAKNTNGNLSPATQSLLKSFGFDYDRDSATINPPKKNTYVKKSKPQSPSFSPDSLMDSPTENMPLTPELSQRISKIVFSSPTLGKSPTHKSPMQKSPNSDLPLKLLNECGFHSPSSAKRNAENLKKRLNECPQTYPSEELMDRSNSNPFFSPSTFKDFETTQQKSVRTESQSCEEFQNLQKYLEDFPNKSEELIEKSSPSLLLYYRQNSQFLEACFHNLQKKLDIFSIKQFEKSFISFVNLLHVGINADELIQMNADKLSHCIQYEGYIISYLENGMKFETLKHLSENHFWIFILYINETKQLLTSNITFEELVRLNYAHLEMILQIIQSNPHYARLFLHNLNFQKFASLPINELDKYKFIDPIILGKLLEKNDLLYVNLFSEDQWNYLQDYPSRLEFLLKNTEEFQVVFTLDPTGEKIDCLIEKPAAYLALVEIGFTLKNLLEVDIELLEVILLLNKVFANFINNGGDFKQLEGINKNEFYLKIAQMEFDRLKEAGVDESILKSLSAEDCKRILINNENIIEILKLNIPFQDLIQAKDAILNCPAQILNEFLIRGISFNQLNQQTPNTLQILLNQSAEFFSFLNARVPKEVILSLKTPILQFICIPAVTQAMLHLIRQGESFENIIKDWSESQIVRYVQYCQGIFEKFLPIGVDLRILTATKINELIYLNQHMDMLFDFLQKGKSWQEAMNLTRQTKKV